MRSIKVKLIDNFRLTGDNSIIWLTVNGVELWNSSMLKKKEKKEVQIDESETYELKLFNKETVFKRKTFDKLDNKLIKVVSRQSPMWMGLRGLIWESIITLIDGKYAFKVKKK